MLTIAHVASESPYAIILSSNVAFAIPAFAGEAGCYPFRAARLSTSFD
jgi:hypothetical protein